MKPKNSEILVIGGGPAGLSAAIEAAGFGAAVTVVDENDRAGGQLFKQIHKFFGSARHQAGIRGVDIGRRLISKATNLGVEMMLQTTAVGIFGDLVALEIPKDEMEVMKPSRVILALGASENPFSFPGWTLPGVMNAGAAQTFINIHRVSVGEKILIVGSGNVGLIVAYQLLQAGSEVVGIVEALPEIGGWAVHASKVRRQGIPIYTSHTIKEAIGTDRVSRVVIQEVDERLTPVPGTEQEIEADTVCLAVGMSPRVRLAQMRGCKLIYLSSLGGFVPIHATDMETTECGFFVAGDTTGVEEASTAMEEGKLAGIAAASSLGYVPRAQREERLQEINASLRELRIGPFGKERGEAKEKVVKAHEQFSR